MKLIYTALFVSLLIIGCQPADDSVNEAFERNSKVVLAELEGWSKESMDYDALYAPNALIRPTAFNAPDSMTLAELKESNQDMWNTFDFQLSPDPVVLLPGVNPKTKKADGSVRYYGTWTVTLPATDSTEARSGSIKFYESYDFNAEGKIIYQQGYGDFGGLFEYLMDDDEDEEEDETGA